MNIRNSTARMLAVDSYTESNFAYVL